ncbi:zinc-dependent alcohol dehydrogenase family protein [Paenibacillus radicis (ex Xue et al. 2023)]|uniref:Zinc-dependent alcohol dehydrogenase family protein n=1 Tax=Paenibacillus radicis (ex Xue et al. 2023) TaxID=2972489 RepID=A0ABT1Y9I2_9BACL|nr:zinc-dependent alcohol dehydrogenase family protein [Paenibacillus radicis (ex Xue et al. 2023)]MCR8629844.1 zinc-dependent alcohol dehydrogenase family protein [Paenibacillus radicis (ex Xue et al. 2023)]
MQAAVLKGTHHIEVTGWENKELASDEVRIRVKSCGICGTDQHIYHGHPGSAAVTPPIVLGHEFAGEVMELGAGVTTLKVGDRVSVDPNMYCGSCKYCRDGRVQLCDRLQAVGVTRDGGMGEWCTAPAANCYLLPDSMSYIEGAMVEPLGCVLHGFKKIDIRPTHTVLVIGGGFIGQLFLQLVKKQGASRIVVSEPAIDKHAGILALGADEVVQPTEAALEGLKNRADVVIECVGRKDSMELAIEAAGKGGQVLLFGVASPETQITVSPFAIFSKELRIYGSFINPHTHEEAIALIEQGIVRVEPIVSHRFKLEEIPEAMSRYGQLNVAKGVIVY